MGTRPGARVASGRVLCAVSVFAMLLLGACRAESLREPVLAATETIVGRATLQHRIVLLTDAPALVAIDPVTGDLTRTQVEARAGQSLWGLAESGGKLFTLADFTTLLPLSTDGTVGDPTPVDPPLTNLIDLPAGMAAQITGASSGEPLLVGLTDDGQTTPMSSPARQSFGLTPAEESLLHLLACSAPPHVVCWRPNDNVLLIEQGGALMDGPRLGLLQPVPAERFVADLNRSLIADLLVSDSSDESAYLVLHDASSVGLQVMSEFDSYGGFRRSGNTPEPLRMLLAITETGIAALTADGRVIRVPRQ